MKESTLLEMKNKIEAQSRVIQALINEISHMRELSVGTLETLKLMPGYEQAIEDLKNNMVKEVEQNKKAKQNGVINKDTK
tara:strand:+ start:411 stop:650 length:240 start_codon:yes stop_codon:yes gene_type:complete